MIDACLKSCVLLLSYNYKTRLNLTIGKNLFKKIVDPPVQQYKGTSQSKQCNFPLQPEAAIIV